MPFGSLLKDDMCIRPADAESADALPATEIEQHLADEALTTGDENPHWATPQTLRAPALSTP